MKNIFGILQFSDPTSCKPLHTNFNLLEQWDIIDLDVLKHHISFMYSYGQEYDLQNLTWTLELMTKLCEQTLGDKL